jgi:uncharacterized protein YbjT (DUF2867 family)
MAWVLLAGASGSLGQEILRSLAERGHWVRTLSRGPRSAAMLFTGEHVRADLTRPDSLTGTCQDVDLVFSSAGSSMHLDDFRNRLRYLNVDFTGNRNLLREAKRKGTPRFVYVLLHGGEKLRHNSYADAHERFVDALNSSPVSSLVIRPTGFFSFLLQILRMAKRCRGVVIGDGSARANPIHQADLGDFSVDHLEPERVHSVPEWVARAAATVARLLNPRIATLLAFGVEESVTDVVAPAYVSRHLSDFFREAAASQAGPPTPSLPTRAGLGNLGRQGPYDTVAYPVHSMTLQVQWHTTALPS